jgi:hypothetical protein
MNVVSLTALVAGIRGIIADPNIVDEAEAMSQANALIEASSWAEEANKFRAEELAKTYFLNREPTSIANAFADSMEMQIPRLTEANVPVINTVDAMQALKYFDAAVFWIALSPDPADEYLARLLGFDPDDGSDGAAPAPRPSWALGSASFGHR